MGGRVRSGTEKEGKGRGGEDGEKERRRRRKEEGWGEGWRVIEHRRQLCDGKNSLTAVLMIINIER